MTRNMQFKAFLGPKFLPLTNAANYPYYSGGSLPALDATIDIEYQTAVLTTLTSGGVTLVTTNSAALYDDFPTQGGLWLGPNGGGQGWEHVDYTGRTTNSFTGLTRESSVYREHNGVHSLGAPVYFWYPLDNNNGEFNFVDALTEDFQARYWRMQLGGFALPPSVLRNDHFLAIVYRTMPSGVWKYFALGITNAAQIRDDWQRKAEWVLYANSLHGLCELVTIHGVHVGELDVAPFGQADSSAPLGSAYKELKSGDYVAAQPDFSAKSAIDGDASTLWINDYMVGPQQTIQPAWDAPTQLYLNPHPGRGPAYKWIELTNFSTNATALFVYDPDTNAEYGLDFQDFSLGGDDYRVILTDDPVTFARENPGHLADYVVDVTAVGIGPTFMKHCKPHGGAMAIKDLFGNYTFPIVWGSVTRSMPPWGWGDGDWRGPAIPAPGYGQTIAFDHAYAFSEGMNDNVRWQIRDYGTPGYMPRTDRPEYAWLVVLLPGMGLSLLSDVGAGATSLYLVDASGEPSTEGLPSSGTIQIGPEQIPFTGKQADRLTGCVVAQSHQAGDLVFVIENGIATDGFPIETVKLVRQGGTIYPKDFYMRWSRVVARVPVQSDHEEDYVAPYGNNFHATTGSTAEFVIAMSAFGAATARIRTLLIEFRRMTTDPIPASPRLNQLQALAALSFFSALYYCPGPADAGEVIFRFLQSAGVAPGAVSYTAVTILLERSFRTARDKAWTSITDFADMCGLYVKMQRDARVTITDNDFWSTAVGGYTPDFIWDKDDVTYVDWVTRTGRGVGQVRIEWQSPDDTLDGTEVFPASLGLHGGIEEIGPYVFATAAAAQLAARKRYYLALVPYHLVVELADVNLAVEAGDTFRLTWQFPGESSPLARLYMVAGVDLRISGEKAVQVVTGLQIDREVLW
jgi:hypothetical protein